MLHSALNLKDLSINIAARNVTEMSNLNLNYWLDYFQPLNLFYLFTCISVFILTPHVWLWDMILRSEQIYFCVHVCSVDSGTEQAHSLPTTVPESPSTSHPRTPRTPRTPGRQDPSKTPRFYPVMKESGAIDGQVNFIYNLIKVSLKWWRIAFV